MNKMALLVWGMLLAVLTAGCNIDFSIETEPIPEMTQLDGSWGGSLQDADGTMHTLELDIASAGQITAYRVDGVDTGTRGSLGGPATGGTVFALRLDTGERGGLLTDASHTHAAYLDSGGKRGVLERDAGAFSTFLEGDVVQPSWGGNYLVLDAGHNLVADGGSLLNVALDRRFDGMDDDGRRIAETTVLALDHPGLGRYRGAYVNLDDPADTGVIVLLLTPDKNHAGAYTCSPDESAAPTGCRYFLWGW